MVSSWTSLRRRVRPRNPSHSSDLAGQSSVRCIDMSVSSGISGFDFQRSGTVAAFLGEPAARCVALMLTLLQRRVPPTSMTDPSGSTAAISAALVVCLLTCALSRTRFVSVATGEKEQCVGRVFHQAARALWRVRRIIPAGAVFSAQHASTPSAKLVTSTCDDTFAAQKPQRVAVLLNAATSKQTAFNHSAALAKVARMSLFPGFLSQRLSSALASAAW
jgi:uncharacterized membrane protein YeiB